MKAFLKELTFPSTDYACFKNLTEEVKKAVKKSKVKQGIVVVNSKHTTLTVVVQEISEPNLLKDMLEFALKTVPTDSRAWQAKKKGFNLPTSDYLHRCQDNPFCNEVDEDYNAPSHIRSMLYGHPSVFIPIQNGKPELGKYQEIAALEFDGRDGSGKNAIRQRTIQIWIYPIEEVISLQ
ncbi:MAG: YjbQ family protein [Candidatus Daviesbacteria bacterium]|nr:YjbQ family protein [Candidatus Daviesbacteria bacterium]